MTIPKGTEVHFMADTDPESLGPVALCDIKAGLTEDDDLPRAYTLSSIFEDDVNCPNCLKHLGGTDG